MSTRALVEEILDKRCFAVTGASHNPDKYGYKVYKSLKNAALSAGYKVYAVNPNTDTVDGDPCYPSLDNVPDPIDCVVTVTPPSITEDTVHSAGHLHIPYIWMQPGSESTAAFNTARANSMQIVSGGPCIMTALQVRRSRDTSTPSVTR
jgi:predicted CoA-binding protein